jgi:pyruvate formate lyase activating enzyme
MKGCPLECLWCSNPESQNAWPEITHNDSLCNKCMRCIDVCEPKAISVDSEGVHIDRKLCTNCGKCVEVCIPQALKIFGEEMSVEEVLQEVEKDISYYQNSGGGVTASGGEPLYQSDFVAALFKLCQDRGIHTCLDTSGYAATTALDKVLKHTSLVLFDLKHMDSATHRKLTNKGNDSIIRNLELIVARGTPLIIRLPLIPGHNNSDEAIRAIARHVAGMNQSKKVEILAYHRFGVGKYKMLDRQYKLGQLTSPTDTELQQAKEIFGSLGVNCEVLV